MGQATNEAQHIKQVLEEMAIPNLSSHITMSINTDSSAGKAVASRLGLNKKTKQPGHCTTWRDDSHKDSNNTQSGRRVDVASTSDDNSVTFGASMPTDDTTDSQHCNHNKDSNWNDHNKR
eukprot:4577221-Amphidinium_carterae.1